MYRLMMSQKVNRGILSDGSHSLYRQTEIDHFINFNTALNACELANCDSKSRFYVLNEVGKEYYDFTWID
jgi:hypothetical protein